MPQSLVLGCTVVETWQPQKERLVFPTPKRMRTVVVSSLVPLNCVRLFPFSL